MERGGSLSISNKHLNQVTGQPVCCVSAEKLPGCYSLMDGGSHTLTMGTWVNKGGGVGVGVGAEPRRGLAAFIHAEQQLQAQSNPRVPPEGKDADVARHNWRPQEVLH